MPEIPQEWVDAAMDGAAGKHLNDGEEFHGDDLDFEAAVAAVVPLIRKQVIAEVEEALTKALTSLPRWTGAYIAEHERDGEYVETKLVAAALATLTKGGTDA